MWQRIISVCGAYLFAFRFVAVVLMHEREPKPHDRYALLSLSFTSPHLAALRVVAVISSVLACCFARCCFCRSFAYTATCRRLSASIYSSRLTSRLLLSVLAASRCLSYESRAAVSEELAVSAAPHSPSDLSLTRH